MATATLPRAVSQGLQVLPRDVALRVQQVGQVWSLVTLSGARTYDHSVDVLVDGKKVYRCMVDDANAVFQDVLLVLQHVKPPATVSS